MTRIDRKSKNNDVSADSAGIIVLPSSGAGMVVLPGGRRRDYWSRNRNLATSFTNRNHRHYSTTAGISYHQDLEGEYSSVDIILLYQFLITLSQTNHSLPRLHWLSDIAET